MNQFMSILAAGLLEHCCAGGTRSRMLSESLSMMLLWYLVVLLLPEKVGSDD